MSNIRKNRTASTKFGEGSENLPQMPPTVNTGAEDAVGDGAGKQASGTGEQVQGKTASEKQKYVCKGGIATCGRILADKEDCIMCDACEGWFHPKCQGLSIEAFKALAKYDFIFLCLECRPKLKELVEMKKCVDARIERTEQKIMTALQRELDRTEQKIVTALEQLNPGRATEDIDCKIDVLEKKVVEEIRTHQVRMEETLKEQQETVREMPKFTEEIKSSANEIRNYVREKEEKEVRGKNLILHNIPECTSEDPQRRRKYDHDSFRNVVEALLGEGTEVEVENVFRLGKKKMGESDTEEKRDKPRLMLIKLKETKDVEAIMRNRLMLKERGFENIYITRDMPPEERERQKKLRQEWAEKGKKTHVIFHGKVVPRKERGNEGSH